MKKKHRACISRVEILGPGLGRVDLAGPGIGAGARPGQFAMLEAVGRPDAVLLRPFSFFSAAEDQASFLVKDVGKGSHALLAAHPGDPVGLLGPLGTAFPDPRGETWIVAGGVGAAPFGGVAGTEAVTVLFGSRTLPDTALGAALAAQGLRVEYATDDGSRGYAGTVTSLLRRKLSTTSVRPQLILACGPDPMLREVAHIAGAQQIACWVSLEAQMGCGFGVCRGCAHRDAQGKWRCICDDGPVYEAEVMFTS